MVLLRPEKGGGILLRIGEGEKGPVAYWRWEGPDAYWRKEGPCYVLENCVLEKGVPLLHI